MGEVRRGGGAGEITSWTTEKGEGEPGRGNTWRPSRYGLPRHVRVAISCLVQINLTCEELERNVFCAKEHCLYPVSNGTYYRV